jgi:hypothetical protein
VLDEIRGIKDNLVAHLEPAGDEVMADSVDPGILRRRVAGAAEEKAADMVGFDDDGAQMRLQLARQKRLAARWQAGEDDENRPGDGRVGLA